MWRDAHDVRGTHSVGDVLFDEIDQRLGVGEQVRLVAAPERCYDERGIKLMEPLGLAVTNHRVIVAKKKLFGGVRLTEWPVLEFLRYHLGLFMGGGPSWELVQYGQRGAVKLVFSTHDEAEAVAEYINSSILLLRWNAEQSG